MMYQRIDWMIAQMKHRDELQPYYDSYKALSGFKQSRYRKKNAAYINDYEQTVLEIHKHKDSFTKDGRMATVLELLDRSNELKSQYNVLSVKQQAYLDKCEAAERHKDKVKKYLDAELVKSQNEKSKKKELHLAVPFLKYLRRGEIRR